MAGSLRPVHARGCSVIQRLLWTNWGRPGKCPCKEGFPSGRPRQDRPRRLRPAARAAAVSVRDVRPIWGRLPATQVPEGCAEQVLAALAFPDREHQVVGICRQWHHSTTNAAFFCSPIQGASIHGTCPEYPKECAAMNRRVLCSNSCRHPVPAPCGTGSETRRLGYSEQVLAAVASPDRGHQVVGMCCRWQHSTTNAAFFCSPIQGASIHGACSESLAA